MFSSTSQQLLQAKNVLLKSSPIYKCNKCNKFNARFLLSMKQFHLAALLWKADYMIERNVLTKLLLRKQSSKKKACHNRRFWVKEAPLLFSGSE